MALKDFQHFINITLWRPAIFKNNPFITLKNMKNERIYTYLAFIGAIAFFAAGIYIVFDTFIKTRNIDFTWASNIFLGIAGVLFIAGGYLHNLAKEKEADLFSD